MDMLFNPVASLGVMAPAILNFLRPFYQVSRNFARIDNNWRMRQENLNKVKDQRKICIGLIFGISDFPTRGARF